MCILSACTMMFIVSGLFDASASVKVASIVGLLLVSSLSAMYDSNEGKDASISSFATSISMPLISIVVAVMAVNGCASTQVGAGALSSGVLSGVALPMIFASCAMGLIGAQSTFGRFPLAPYSLRQRGHTHVFESLF